MLQTPEFWVALAFVLVVAGLFKPVAKGLVGALDTRANKIRTQIEEARRLREDAQAVLAEYQRKQRDALAEAERIISGAKEAALLMKTEAAADLERAIERRKAQALERIAQAETQALTDVRNAAADVALAAAEALLRDNLKGPQQQALTDNAIAELPQRLN